MERGIKAKNCFVLQSLLVMYCIYVRTRIYADGQLVEKNFLAEPPSSDALSSLFYSTLQLSLQQVIYTVFKTVKFAHAAFYLVFY
jgi:hypothetical protein